MDKEHHDHEAMERDLEALAAPLVAAGWVRIGDKTDDGDMHGYSRLRAFARAGVEIEIELYEHGQFDGYPVNYGYDPEQEMHPAVFSVPETDVHVQAVIELYRHAGWLP